MRPERALLMGLTVLAMVGLPGGRAASVGWTLRPQPSWRPWLGLFGATLLICLALTRLDTREASLGDLSIPLWQLPHWQRFQAEGSRVLWELWVFIPVIEEGLYRVALGSALVACYGRRWALLLCTLAFAGLHWRYDQLALVHVFAGWFLTWIYLRSGSLWVPLGVHMLANVAVFSGILWR